MDGKPPVVISHPSIQSAASHQSDQCEFNFNSDDRSIEITRGETVIVPEKRKRTVVPYGSRKLIIKSLHQFNNGTNVITFKLGIGLVKRIRAKAGTKILVEKVGGKIILSKSDNGKQIYKHGLYKGDDLFLQSSTNIKNVKLGNVHYTLDGDKVIIDTKGAR